MKRLHSSTVAALVSIVVASAPACSSSTSDPSPTPTTEAGADATATVDGGVDAAHPVTACTSAPAVSCARQGFGTIANGCTTTGDACSDGHGHTADCDGDGNCVCSVDGVPDCTCATGTKICENGDCVCSSDGYCCFKGGGVVGPGGG